jgi:prevent-host-death family protein
MGAQRVKTVNISEFRANLLKFLEIANAGQQISITSNGKLLATVSPPVDQQATAREQLAAIAATAEIGDVVSPTDTKWDALA